MSVVSEIERIKTNITNAYTALEEKGATIPTERNSANLRSVVATIPTGGGSEVTKGLIINECDSDGYITDASIVGFTEIPDYHFYNVGCSNARNRGIWSRVGANVHLPSNLTKIGQSAFYEWNYSWAITELPDSVTEIGQYAFYNNRYLALTKLPSSLIKLNSYAFNNCENLKVSETPVGLTLIPNSAFYRCSSISEMTIKGAITQIDSNAFYGCSKLTKLVIPNITSVPTLKNTSAFNNTPIASGTGYFYIPDELVTEMQGASNWTTYASQIKGVSEL